MRNHQFFLKFLIIIPIQFVFCYCIKGQCPGNTVPGNNLTVNGDFSAGNTDFSSSYTYGNTVNCLYPAETYAVGADPTFFHDQFVGSDHTTGTGNFMIVNGSNTINLSVWCQTISIIPNTNYIFSTWVCTVYPSNPAQLQFSINGSNIGSTFTASNSVNIWTQFSATWNSGSNTTATICIVNQNTGSIGNDFGLDDISFQPCICNPIQVSPDTTICEGTSVVLTASGASTYSWEPSTNLSTLTDSSVTALPSATTTYTVIGFNSDSSCSDTSGILVMVNSIPTVNAGPDISICQGYDTTLYVLGSGISYWWSPTTGLSSASGTSVNANPSITTSYTITATDANGCINTDTINIIVYPKAEAIFTPDPIEGQLPLTVNFTNTSTNATTYEWNYGDNSLPDTTINPQHIYTEGGEYIVQLIANNSNNCPDTSIYSYIKADASSTLWIPNSFTPNGDGKNNLFMIYTSRISTLEVNIYNRWGEMIYQWNTLTGSWDGTCNGIAAQQGVYMYVIKAKGLDSVKYQKSGPISLIR